jgi:hypothetical protein
VTDPVRPGASPVQYFKPYTYFLKKKPNGTTNVLWGSLAVGSTMVIPVIGQLVLLGYQSECVDDLKDDPEIEQYPDFDPNRFVEYLTRSLWPFLVQLLVSVVTVLFVFIGYALGGLAWYATKEPVVGVAVAVLLLFPITIVAGILSWPMMLHAQVTREFRFGAMTRFAANFVRKVGGQMVVVMIVHLLISLPLVLAGMLLCFVGVFPAAVIVTMAQEHFIVQLYRVYLDEGGEPIGGPSEQLEYDET